MFYGPKGNNYWLGQPHDWKNWHMYQINAKNNDNSPTRSTIIGVVTEM